MKKFYKISLKIWGILFVIIILGVFDVIEFNILRELNELDFDMTRTEENFSIYLFVFFCLFYLCLLFYYEFWEPVETFKDIEDKK